MLEGLAAWILNNYLGKYVEDLNTDQLSIAVLSGEVELENLPLRTDALRNLGAPIEVRAGHIGKVKLQIPVRQLRTAPWVIVIERLYIVAGPVPCEDPTGERAAAERLAAQDRKLATLDAIEACWRVETDSRSTPGYYATSYTSWLSYGTGVITDIVENLQLNVVDVHIRYEDSTSVPNMAVTCGLTIGALTAHTCDENWVPCSFSQTSERSEHSFKLVELKELAVYWDSKPLNDCEGFLVADRSGASLAPQVDPKQHLVAPVNASARLQRNRSEKPLRGSSQPRFVCDLKLDEVPLSLDDVQYEQIIALSRGLDLSAQAQTRRALRPAGSPGQEARAWWQYLARRVVPHLRLRVSFEASLDRARDNVRYVQLYVTLLQRPVGVLPPADRAFKERFEWDRNLSELQALREVAMRRTPSQPQNVSTTRGLGTLVHWFPQWCGWRQAVVEGGGASAAAAPTEESRKQLEQEILEVLADSALDSTVLRRDALFGRFNFELTSGALKLCERRDSHSTTKLEFEFSGLCLSLEWRPRSSSLTVELSIGGIFLRDYLTPGSLFPVLVGAPETERHARGRRNQASATPQTPDWYHRKPRRSLYPTSTSPTQAPGPGAPLFELVYTCAGPLERRLHVRSRPLDVVYQPAAARWLVEFLCAPHQRVSARRRLRDVGVRTRHGLAAQFTHVLGGRVPGGETRRPQWDVRLDVSAPQLILVERFADPDSAIAVLDFGRLRLRSGGEEPTAVQDEQSAASVEEEDEEQFMTPCSTPPGSEASADSDTTYNTTTAAAEPPSKKNIQNALSSDSLRQKLYEIYRVDLTDIQVLIGRAKDDWRRAHTRGASSLHVLDRACLALVVERRLVHTSDSTYPSLAVSGTLPRLGAHLNEHKVESARALLRMLHDTGVPSPLHGQPPPEGGEDDRTDEDINGDVLDGIGTLGEATEEEESDTETRGSSEEGETSTSSGRLVALRWVVEKCCLALEARGRGIAELQVSRVVVAAAARPNDTSASLSVHGLLLVDALQTHGPDFELLAASHRHVGMDSVSGRLLDSEPTSPTSPASPEPSVMRPEAAPPAVLSRALSGLESWYSGDSGGALLNAVDDVQDALISVEAIWVSAPEPFHYINVQCNNLDITANQETMVELVTFLRRVVPLSGVKGTHTATNPEHHETVEEQQEKAGLDSVPQIRTEITFDFQRLTVLLLRRAVTSEGRAIGKKVATATAVGAKLHSTTWKDGTTWLRGSLAGLQVVDLTTERSLHRRIISAGLDPLSDSLDGPFDAKPLFPESDDEAALTFQCAHANTNISLQHMWYTHSPDFLTELMAVANEFNAYFNLSATKTYNPIPRKPSSNNYKLELNKLRIVLPTERDELVLLGAVHRATVSFERGLFKTAHGAGLSMQYITVNSTGRSRKVRRASDLYEKDVTPEPLLQEASVHVSATWLKSTEDLNETCKIDMSVPEGLHLIIKHHQLTHVLYVLRNFTNWKSPQVAKLTEERVEPDSLYHLSEFPLLELEPEVLSRLDSQTETPQKASRNLQLRLEIPSVDVDMQLSSSSVSITATVLRVSYETWPEVAEIRAGIQYIRAERPDRPGQLLSVQADWKTVRENLSQSFPGNGPFSNASPFGGSLPNRLSSPVQLQGSDPRCDDSSEDEAQTCIGENALQISCDIYPNRKEISVSMRRVEANLSVNPWRELLNLFTNGETSSSPQSETHSDWCVKINTLILTARRKQRVVFRARTYNFNIRMNQTSNLQLVRVYAKRLAITDLTKHGHCLDTRLEVMTSKRAACAIDIRYEKQANSFPRLRMDLAPFVYVHTARFFTEFNCFLEEMMQKSVDKQKIEESPSKQNDGATMAIRLAADTSLLLLPGNTNENYVLGLPVGRFLMDGEPDAPTTISFTDIGMYSYRVHETSKHHFDTRNKMGYLLEGKELKEEGSMLLGNRGKLDFTVIRRKPQEKGSPKMRVSGRLSGLEVSLDEAQSSLVGAVLYRNLADDVSDVYEKFDDDDDVVPEESDDCLLSVRLDVPSIGVHLKDWCNVQLEEVRLVTKRTGALDRTSGLVCGHATVTDARPSSNGNHFVEVLGGCGPTTMAPQLELHAGTRGNASTKHTVLLNGTRLTLLADWWRETVRRLRPAPVASGRRVNFPTAYEIRVNATESELLILTEAKSATADALLLRSTTLVTYRATPEPDASIIRTLSSSISQCSALWHPASLQCSPIAGPTAITVELTADGTLEMQLLELTSRVSIQDIIALQRIVTTLTDVGGTPNTSTTTTSIQPTNRPTSPCGGPSQKLATMLGFSEEDSEFALRVCNNSVDDAALWLTQNARPTGTTGTPALVRGYRINASRIHVCLVDEIEDADVPLFELALSELAVTLLDDSRAQFDAIFALDYYNRALSAWEPLLEPWRCEVTLATEIGDKKVITVSANGVLDINLTDELIVLARYLLKSSAQTQRRSTRTRRAVFVPYTVRNETGVAIRVCAQLLNHDELAFERMAHTHVPADAQWLDVAAGQELAVPFGDEREARRGRGAPPRASRSLWVQATGWSATIPPVAVERAGVFGRRVEREDDSIGSAVLVIDVRPVAGSARHVILVRGALVLVNRLPYAVDVKLEPERRAVSAAGRAAVLRPRRGRFVAPLAVAHSAAVYVRPAHPLEAFAYARSVPADSGVGALARCATNRGAVRWIWAEVKTFGGPRLKEREVHLVAGILLVNMLPQELQYMLGTVEGSVPPGESETVPQMDPEANLDLRIRLDNFSCVQPATIPPSDHNSSLETDVNNGHVNNGASPSTPGGAGDRGDDELRLLAVLEDERGRRLQLRVRAERNRGARLRLTVTAPYWLTNRTGLPLVFRQQGAGRDAAGQFAEHEVARMRAPLPFSLSEPEAAAAVEIRIGGGTGSSSGGGMSQWCRAVHLRVGEHVRRLVAPDGVLYVVGVEVSEQRSRGGTTVVTVSPRHQLYNGTNLRLEIARWPPAAAEKERTVVATPPACHMPYHLWPSEPRQLCIRTAGYCWSGAISVDVSEATACRLALRPVDEGGALLFLQTEIVPHGAARLIVFSEASALPPPLRLDNWAAVRVWVAQLGMRRPPLPVPARRSLPYAWDEPTEQLHLVVRGPGGAALLCEPEHISPTQHIQHLAYENFIYIALTATFDVDVDGAADELVLEASESGAGRIVAAQRMVGRRTQLWRMTAGGQLQHEGGPAGETRVLDISTPAPRPPELTPLALRRLDQRRKSTQTWHFTGNGRLCCAHRHLCVQIVDKVAYLGLCADEVPVPTSQLISAKRMRPGSGLLAVDMYSDGATKVIRVTDAREPQGAKPLCDENTWSGVHRALWPHAPAGSHEDLDTIKPKLGTIRETRNDSSNKKSDIRSEKNGDLEISNGDFQRTNATFERREEYHAGGDSSNINYKTKEILRVKRNEFTSRIISSSKNIMVDLRSTEEEDFEIIENTTEDNKDGIVSSDYTQKESGSISNEDIASRKWLDMEKMVIKQELNLERHVGNGLSTPVVTRELTEKEKILLEKQLELEKESEKTDYFVPAKSEEDMVRGPGLNFRVTFHVCGGVGLSVISRGHELLYARTKDVLVEVASTMTGYSFCGSVRTLQCDNQAAGAGQPIVLYMVAGEEGGARDNMPALEIRGEVQVSPVPRLVICPHLVVCTAPLALHLDEVLLLRLYDMYLQHADASLGRYYYYYYYYDGEDGEDMATVDGLEEERNDGAPELSATTVAANVAAATRYHFGVLRLAPGPLRLGAQTASAAQLSGRMRQLRRRLGLSLVAFEDAHVQLEAYARSSTLETGPRILQSIRTHFRDELRWQAASILGSVDFLGAPLNLLGDVRAGVSGMIRERSVGALLAGVAHGLSNSAAKVTETLGDGLGRVALLDEAHEEARRRALQTNGESGGPTAHLVAGLRGLSFGLLAGATGVFTHAYEGATSDGWQGAISGFGRGLLGAVAKPVVGVLDLATETARAVRDTSRGAGARAPRPRRTRPPRVPRCEVAGRPLTPYNSSDTLGQQLLMHWNHDRELFVAYERLYADLHALVSSECVRVVSRGGGSSGSRGASSRGGAGGGDSEVRVVLEAQLADLLGCRISEQRGKHYVELALRGGSGVSGTRKPRVRCDGPTTAHALCRRVAQAKRLHEAALYTLRTNTNFPAI